MKQNKGKFQLVTVFLIAFCWGEFVHAQSLPDPDGLVQMTTAPTNAIYWSMSGHFPPSPFDPLPDMTLYWGGVSNNYIYDDRQFDWTNYFERGESMARADASTKDDAPAPPGGLSDGGSGVSSPMAYANFQPPGAGYTNCVTVEAFWCSQISIGSGGIYVTLSNTLPGVAYQLQETTNLAVPSWVNIGEVTASNYTAEFGPIAEAGPNLFFRGAVNTNGQYPAIIESPLNQVAAVGGSATFTVTASGVEPLG
jgi:hypothetical protein